MAVWHDSHREELRLYNASYYEANKEQLRAEARARYATNREREIARSQIYAKEHRVEVNARQRVYNEARKPLRRELLYSITPEQFDRMFADQNGACAICHDPMVRANEPQIDHHHETKLVRGLLCAPCNLALGQFRDDLAIIESAALYLRRS